MKPTEIFSVLDLTRQIRKNGDIFNPLFVGPPGVGKSQIVQQWAKANSLPFIDLRAAYLEAPDLIGFPSIETVGDRKVTAHNIPDFWPTEGEGVLLLEEPNRGTTSVMNTFMQLLTDRKVHKYSLPDGWIIVGCINPESEEHDVNTMDAALKNRFEIFNVTYDKSSFVEYMKKKDFNKTVQLFVESGTWEYKIPEEVGNVAGAKYVSPRSMAKLNAVLQSGVPLNKDKQLLLFQTILGNNTGKDFYKFMHDETPVTYFDLKNDTSTAIKRLKKYSNPEDLQNGMLNITFKDIIENKDITDELLAKVLEVLPADHSISLIKDLEAARGDKNSTLLSRICEHYPNVKKLFKDTLTYGKQ